MIGTGTAIGVHEPKDALLYVICSPCHPYYNNELNLLVTEEYTRSYYKGTGEFKIGSNYSPCLLYQKEANLRGFDQNLWIFNNDITEAGTMNVFVQWINELGVEKVSTPTADGFILPGIVRDSVIQLIRAFSKVPVIEENININLLINAIKQNRVKCIFGTGTAATIVSVTGIGYRNNIYRIENYDTSLLKAIYTKLCNIQQGKIKFNDWIHPIRN